MNALNIKMLIVFLISLATTGIVVPVLIPYLKKLKFGQQILEDGPTWHEKKSGTPTMGGIAFISGTTVAIIVALFAQFDLKLLAMMLASLGFGAIGFLDDYIKVVKKRNLGLTASKKFILQTIVSLAYVLILKYAGILNEEIIIPFTNHTIFLPWGVYVLFILFVITGTVNAVNLTDGLDALASSVTIVSTLFFTLSAVKMEDTSSAYFAFSVCAALIGFIPYNKYPAKVFMGDTGSLYLGGVLGTLAISMKMPLVLIIVGFVYIAETLSVILQVACFKTTGKRIFKMSPIHHHFEMCGWKEKKIVIVFTIAALLFAIAGYVSILPRL